MSNYSFLFSTIVACIQTKSVYRQSIVASSYISQTVQNYETSQNMCLIISRGCSFKKIGKNVPPRGTPGEALTKILNSTPYIVVYCLKKI